MNEGLEELPGKPRPSEEYPEFSRLLQFDRDKWYAWRWPLKTQNASQVQHRINNGILKAFRPAGCYEARVREGILYVRYTGGKEE